MNHLKTSTMKMVCRLSRVGYTIYMIKVRKWFLLIERFKPKIYQLIFHYLSKYHEFLNKFSDKEISYCFKVNLIVPVLKK